MLNRVLVIALRSDLQPMRFLIGMCLIFWAATLTLDPHSKGFPSYGEMGHIASDETWAVLFGVTGFVQWVVMLSKYSESRASLAFACLQMCVMFAATASLYFSAYPHLSSIGAEIALCCASVWVFARTGVTGRRASDGH